MHHIPSSDKEKLFQTLISLKKAMDQGLQDKEEFEKTKAYYEACEWALKFEEKRGDAS